MTPSTRAQRAASLAAHRRLIDALSDARSAERRIHDARAIRDAAIRRAAAMGAPHRAIAREVGLSHVRIRAIVQGDAA